MAGDARCDQLRVDLSAADDREVCQALRAQLADLWVPATLRTSCDLLIFVDQAAEAGASYNLVKLRVVAKVGERRVGHPGRK